MIDECLDFPVFIVMRIKMQDYLMDEGISL
jgi:hypothetical protein